MEKRSDKEVSELLKQLEASVEKDQSTEISVSREIEESVLSPEEILSKLEKHIGAPIPEDEEEKVTDDYSINGYEIEALEEREEEVVPVTEDVPSKETLTSSPEIMEAVVEENSEDHLDTDPSEESDQGMLLVDKVSEFVEKPIVLHETSKETVPQDTKIDTLLADDTSDLTEYFDEEGPIEISVDEEEEVRKRVESFVLDTLDADPDLSIFDAIAAAKTEKEPMETSEMVETDVSVAPSDETILREEEEEEFDYAGTAAMERFFKRDAARVFDASEEDIPDLDYRGFNDVDINLSLTLGSEEELQDTFGFARVRSAKNGFRDPAEEASISDSVYAGDGHEYRSYEQTDSIKLRYKREKKHLYIRFAFVFFLTVFILFFEHIFLTSIKILYVSEFFAVPWRYYAASILLSLLCTACSFKRILSGFSSMLSMTPNPYSPPAFFALLNLIYQIVVLVVYPDQGLLTYNFVLAIFLLFAIADEYMRLSRENLTFNIISERKPKLSLERFEGEGDLKKDGSYLGRHDFFVEKVNFVGNYFSRAGRIPSRQRSYAIGFLVTLLLGVVMMFVSTYTSGSFGNAFLTFYFFIMLSVPMQYLVLGTYPFYSLSKGLKKHDSAILDEEVIDEYATTDTIYLSDDEMFGNHGASVVGLRLYGDTDFYQLLYYAFAVFSHLGAPLCHIFDTSTKEIAKPKEVKINAVSVGGIEATVDGSHRILVGNMAFIRSNGFFPKRNLDDEKKAESGQCSIVYIAVDGVLSAKIYIKYTITKRFEKFVEEMVANGITVGIRSMDPSVNSRMIATLRGNKKPEISVIHPTANELVTIGKHSDSGIITGRNSHMIFRILQQCFHIRKIHKKQMIMHIVSAVLGAGFVTALMITDRFALVPSLLITLYHIIWTAIGLIYTKSKLK